MVHGYNREDFVFTASGPPAAERLVLSPDNVLYCRLKLTVKIDGHREPVDIECAYVFFCYEIKLEY